MKYIQCKVISKSNTLPILIFSEIDDDRNETRKIEIYKDKSIGYAYENVEYGPTGLSELALPEIDEINVQDGLEAEEISPELFERAWTKYVIQKEQI